MTTGARRGEMCAIRWSAVNLDEGRESMWLRHAIRKGSRRRWEEAELKTHQRRRLALDSETVERAARAPPPLRGPRRRARRAAAPGRVRVLRGAGRLDIQAPRLGDPTLRTAGRPARHQDDAPQAAPLLGHGVDPRGGRHPYGRRSARPRRRGNDDAAHLHGVGLGGGPARGRRLGNTDAGPARGTRDAASVHAPIRNILTRRWPPISPRRVEEGEPAHGLSSSDCGELASRHGCSVATARRGIELAHEWGLLIRDGSRGPRSLSLLVQGRPLHRCIAASLSPCPDL